MTTPEARITAALETYRTDLSAYNAVLKAARPVVGDGLGAMFERVCHAESDVADVLADDWPAVLARLAALEIVARRVTPTFLCEDEVEEIATLRTADTDIQCLAGYIRDQDIEIDRSHEREAAQGARLAAADADLTQIREAIAAGAFNRLKQALEEYDGLKCSTLYTNNRSASNKAFVQASEDLYTAAVVTYDALIGTGESKGAADA